MRKSKGVSVKKTTKDIHTMQFIQFIINHMANQIEFIIQLFLDFSNNYV